METNIKILISFFVWTTLIILTGISYMLTKNNLLIIPYIVFSILDIITIYKGTKTEMPNKGCINK